MKFFLVLSFLSIVYNTFADDNRDYNNRDRDRTNFQNYGSTTNSLYCQDLNPQQHVDIEQILGMWFATEVINHNEEGSEGEYVYETCVVIHITETTNEYQEISAKTHRTSGVDYSSYDYEERLRQTHGYRSSAHAQRHLRLIWDEHGEAVEYSLRFNNSRRGFWISSAPQHGSMLNLSYKQFTGTVQVMKAVGNHLVLTFCQSLPHGQVFSVILSRQPHVLSRDDIQSIRNLLRRRGLSVQTVRKVCRNGSSTVQVGYLALISLALISFLSRKL